MDPMRYGNTVLGKIYFFDFDCLCAAAFGVDCFGSDMDRDDVLTGKKSLTVFKIC
jgi:hypothetical protein